MAINKIMVIGAGQMGGGIAQVAAEAGIEVVLNDVSAEFIEKRLAFIDKLLSKNIEKKKISEEQKAEILARFTPSTDLADAADVDLVIEAAIENIEIKENNLKAGFFNRSQ